MPFIISKTWIEMPGRFDFIRTMLSPLWRTDPRSERTRVHR